MQYRDLRDFIRSLEQRGELKRVTAPVSPILEMTEICDRTLRKQGPALLFENPVGFSMPVLGNLFGTPQRVALGMGAEDVGALREIGKAGFIGRCQRSDDMVAVSTVGCQTLHLERVPAEGLANRAGGKDGGTGWNGGAFFTDHADFWVV